MCIFLRGFHSFLKIHITWLRGQSGRGLSGQSLQRHVREVGWAERTFLHLLYCRVELQIKCNHWQKPPYSPLIIKILKEETQKVSFNLKYRELGYPVMKRHM